MLCPTCKKSFPKRSASKPLGECPRCATARFEAARAPLVARLVEAALAARRFASLNASAL